MKNKVQQFFIGKYLTQTDDVFEKARLIMFYRFMLTFSVLFILPVLADYSFALKIALVKHSIDLVLIIGLLFFLRLALDFEKVLNFFFIIVFFSSMSAFMILNPMKLETIAILWAVFFLALSALLQRGRMRIMFCFFLGWMPMLYVLINIQLKGALTVDFLFEKNAPADPPVFLMFLPIFLLISAMWSHASTIQKARETITLQKKLIEVKNLEMTDSLRYAKRIQNSLMPSDKLMSILMKRVKK